MHEDSAKICARQSSLVVPKPGTQLARVACFGVTTKRSRPHRAGRARREDGHRSDRGRDVNEPAMVRNAGMKFFRIPMTTHDEPAQKNVARVLRNAAVPIRAGVPSLDAQGVRLRLLFAPRSDQGDSSTGNGLCGSDERLGFKREGYLTFPAPGSQSKGLKVDSAGGLPVTLHHEVLPMIVTAEPIDLDALRVRNEFLAMPGLTISVPQVARMLGLRSEHAAAILETLEHERFLTHIANGAYRRASLSHGTES